jgi:hypothetical protein
MEEKMREEHKIWAVVSCENRYPNKGGEGKQQQQHAGLVFVFYITGFCIGTIEVELYMSRLH